MMRTDVRTKEVMSQIRASERISPELAMEIITEMPSEELFLLADEVRRRYHPDNVVTYVVDRNINYSNICTSVCTFCAFYRKPGSPEGYVLSYEDIYKKVEETLELGGSGILMQGGLHPDLPLEWYETLFRELKSRYSIHLHCFSPPEIDNFAKIFGMSVETVLTRLLAAGLDSIPGGGGEILVDEIRKRRRTECNSQEWLYVMQIAHSLGIPTTATMMFGLGETIAHRIEHLEKLRTLQDQTKGFISFIAWTFQPDNTPLGRKFPDRIDGNDYLRWMALCRIYLDNIANLQVSWLTQGLDIGRKGLHCGANDIGSTMIEENVISPAGANHKATEKMLVDTIIGEGFKPCKRNAAYRRLD